VDPVGRDAELAALRGALDDVVGGVGRLVLVAGDAGIGKSTLVDAFRPYAAAAGATWLWGAGWEDGGAPSYWPWVQVLRAAARASSAEVAARRDGLGPLGPSGPGAAAPDQFVLYDAVVDLLAAMAARTPVVVVLEDLHAAGPATAQLLEFVARFGRHARLLLIGTYRPAEVGADADLSTVITRLESAGALVAPGPLSGAEITTVLEDHRVTATPDLVTAVHERTQGNPLFVSHVVRQLAAGGSPADAGLPLGLRNALRRQAASATGTSTVPDALDAAAVLGPDVRLDVLSAVLDAPSQQVRPVLDAATEAGLLRTDLAVPGAYLFTHALVREALHDGIPPAKLADLHLRAGHALAAAGAGPDRLAYHFLAAWPTGGAVEAASLCRRVADLATAAHAHAEAARALENALISHGRIPAADAKERCDLLVRLASAQFNAGRTTSARKTAASAVALADSLGDADLLGRAALQSASHLPFNSVDHDVIDLLHRAEARWEGRTSPNRAAILSRLAGVTAPIDRETARATAERAEEVALALGAAVPERDRATALSAALTAQLEVTWGQHEPATALETARRLAELAVDPAEKAAAAIWVTAFGLELGDTATAESAVQSLERIAQRERQPSLRHLALSRRATLTTLLGDHAEGLRLLHEARSVARRAGLPDADAVGWGQLFAVWRCADLSEDDARLMERVARDLAEASPFPLAHDAAVVQMVAARGEIESAKKRFRRLMRAVGTLSHDLLYCWTIALLAEDAVLLEDADAAGVLYEALLPLADRFVVAAGAVVCLGSTSHQLGRLASLLGKPDDARAHLETAVRAHRLAGCVALLAASESALAQLSAVAVVQEPDGPVVTVRYRAEVAQLPRSLGLGYLAVLISNPGKEIPAAHLVALAAGAAEGDVRPEGASSPRASDEVLDKAALASYRTRLAAIDAELDEARDWNDAGRIDRLEDERDFLFAELSGALGIGGRQRRFADEAERARVNVTRAIRSAIRKLGAQAPNLAAHLDAAVTTGKRCRYDP
jgi:hypothetical protein